MAELQYRGVIWSHKNGRDWTIAGFLQSADGGLGIAVGADTATKEAMQRALLKLADEPVAHLRKEAPLRAPFFDALLNPDEVRRLLQWMNDPQGYPAQLTAERMAVVLRFVQRQVRPSSRERRAAHGGREARHPATAPGQPSGIAIEEAPDAYPNLPALLRQARPQQLALFGETEPTWPQDNEQPGGSRCGRTCSRCTILTAVVARHPLLDLEAAARPAPRLGLGQAGSGSAGGGAEAPGRPWPRRPESPLGGATVEAVAAAYAGWGWQVDAAVLDALAAVEKADDVAAVKAAILPLYRPWLEGAARCTAGRYTTATREQDYVVTSLPPADAGHVRPVLRCACASTWVSGWLARSDPPRPGHARPRGAWRRCRR